MPGKRVRAVRIEGAVALIPLGRSSDRYAIVDASDAPVVQARNWFLSTRGYVCTNMDLSGRRTCVTLHGLLWVVWGLDSAAWGFVVMQLAFIATSVAGWWNSRAPSPLPERKP